jgi:hypothetical protein
MYGVSVCVLVSVVYCGSSGAVYCHCTLGPLAICPGTEVWLLYYHFLIAVSWYCTVGRLGSMLLVLILYCWSSGTLSWYYPAGPAVLCPGTVLGNPGTVFWYSTGSNLVLYPGTVLRSPRTVSWYCTEGFWNSILVLYWGIPGYRGP